MCLFTGSWVGRTAPGAQMSAAGTGSQSCFRICSWTNIVRHVSIWVFGRTGPFLDNDLERLELDYSATSWSAVGLSLLGLALGHGHVCLSVGSWMGWSAPLPWMWEDGTRLQGCSKIHSWIKVRWPATGVWMIMSFTQVSGQECSQPVAEKGLRWVTGLFQDP